MESWPYMSQARCPGVELEPEFRRYAFNAR